MFITKFLLSMLFPQNDMYGATSPRVIDNLPSWARVEKKMKNILTNDNTCQNTEYLQVI